MKYLNLLWFLLLAPACDCGGPAVDTGVSADGGSCSVDPELQKELEPYRKYVQQVETDYDRQDLCRGLDICTASDRHLCVADYPDEAPDFIIYEYSCEKSGTEYHVCECGACKTTCYNPQTKTGACSLGWWIIK